MTGSGTKMCEEQIMNSLISKPRTVRPLQRMLLLLQRLLLPLNLTLNIIILVAASGATSSSSSRGGEYHQQREERRRYAKLPPTVFAPGGRLHGVERVAREAMLLCDDDDNENDDGEKSRRYKSSSSSIIIEDEDDIFDDWMDEDDVTSCTTFAICCRPRCGVHGERSGDNNGHDSFDREENDNEFAVMVGIGPVSPYLHRDREYDETHYDNENSTPRGNMPEPLKKMKEFYQSLTIDDNENNLCKIGTSLSPLSILSPHLVIGTGGKSIDSAILLRRTIEVAVDSYANEDGGVGWFISHSLEGSTSQNNGWGMNEDELLAPKGGVAYADVSSLVRRVADIAQISTQSLGGKYGRMLSSSLLALGLRDSTVFSLDNVNASEESYQMNSSSLREHNSANVIHPDKDKLILWCVEPTGQFWRLDASAIGRGCSDIENELLKRVRVWNENRIQSSRNKISEIEENEIVDNSVVRNTNVRGYLGSLSVSDAVELAIDCLVKGIIIRRSRLMKKSRKKYSIQADRAQQEYERELKRRIQAVVVRARTKSTDGWRRSYVEVIT